MSAADCDSMCRRSMHTFNPAPGTVPRSALLGVCLECQAETVIDWFNRSRWNNGLAVDANHTAGCSHRHENRIYVKPRP